MVKSGDSGKFKETIINGSKKRIRSLSIDLVGKFNNLYQEYIIKENKDTHYTYRYEIFTEFLNKISFTFDYLNDLLTYEENIEVEWFINSLFKTVSSKDWYSGNEFILKSTPYYLTMIFGSIMLKNDRAIMIDKFFDFEFQRDTGKYHNVMKNVSYFGEGWRTIGKEIYKLNYILPRYTIIQENLLPSITTVEEFNHIDAYITLYFLFNDLNAQWVAGSAMGWRSSYLTDVYNKYFKSMLNSKQDYESFISKLQILYDRMKSDLGQGVENLADHIAHEMNQTKWD